MACILEQELISGYKMESTKQSWHQFRQYLSPSALKILAGSRVNYRQWSNIGTINNIYPNGEKHHERLSSRGLREWSI